MPLHKKVIMNLLLCVLFTNCAHRSKNINPTTEPHQLILLRDFQTLSQRLSDQWHFSSSQRSMDKPSHTRVLQMTQDIKGGKIGPAFKEIVQYIANQLDYPSQTVGFILMNWGKGTRGEAIVSHIKPCVIFINTYHFQRELQSSDSYILYNTIVHEMMHILQARRSTNVDIFDYEFEAELVACFMTEQYFGEKYLSHSIRESVIDGLNSKIITNICEASDYQDIKYIFSTNQKSLPYLAAQYVYLLARAGDIDLTHFKKTGLFKGVDLTVSFFYSRPEEVIQFIQAFAD